MRNRASRVLEAWAHRGTQGGHQVLRLHVSLASGSHLQPQNDQGPPDQSTPRLTDSSLALLGFTDVT